MKRKLIHLFLLLQFLFTNSAFSQTEIKNANAENYLQFKILESEHETGKYITGDVDNLGFTEYTGKQTLAALPSENRMLTLRSEFSIDSSIEQEEWVIVIPPIFYACNIYLNGKLIGQRGDIKKGYTSRSHDSISILLSPDILYTNQKNNSLAIELLPKFGEKNSANGFFISNRQTGETYVFWRNLFSVDFIRAMALVSFVIFLYFLIFSFKRKSENTTYYIHFSLICLTFPLSYLNNIISFSFCDALLLEKLSRFGLAFWIFLTPIYILEFTKVFKEYKNRINLALATIYLPFFVLGWLPDTVQGVIEFYIKYTSLLALATGAFAIMICFLFAYQNRTKYAIILSMLYLLTIPSGAHDLYYFVVLQSKPYALLTPYLMFLVVIVFFFIVAWQHSEVYKLALAQSNELRHINENLEQIIKERTENLRLSEEKYHSLFLHSNLGTFHSSFEDRYIELNLTLAKMLGYDSPEEAMNGITSISKQVYAEPSKRDALLTEALNTGGSISIENHYRRKDGSSWYGMLHLRIVFDKEDKPCYYEGFVEDITSRKNIELKLIESEERLSLALLATSDGLWDWNLETDTVYYSPAWMSMLGYAETELESNFSTWEKLIHQDDLERVKTYIKEFLDKKHLRYEIEFRMIHKNGQTIIILSRAVKEFDSQTGKVLRLVGVHMDVTEIRKAEAEIRKLSVAVEQNPSTIFITDTKGNIEYVNQKFTELSGYSLEEVIGKTPRLLQSGKTSKEVYGGLWQTIRAGKTWTGEFINKKKNGEEFIENSIISPIFDKNQKITNFIAIKEDITARKIAEQKLVESEEKYRSLINGLGEMMYRLSLPNGKYEYVSPSVMQIYGYSQKDFIENPLLIMSIIHPDYAKYFYDNWMDLLQGHVAPLYEYKIIDRFRNEKWIQQSNKAIFNEEGKLIAIDGLCRDITLQKNSEIKILEQQQELEKLNEFTKIINSNSNIANILKEIYAYLRKETGYEIVWILLVNKKQDKLFSAENLSVFETQIEFDKEFFLNFRMKLTESLGILYHTYKERIPFYCPDITLSKRNITNHFDGKEHKLHKTDFKIQRKGLFKSMLQFPLLLQNEVIGIINLTAHSKQVEISPAGIHKMMRFADQIAGVIRNAHLLEEAEEAKKEAEMEQRIAEFARLETEKEKEKSEKLLLRILPEKIVQELKETGSTKPISYESVSVMFTDFKGFTKIAEKLSPNDLITELDGCFSYFDSLVERYNLEKLKTIGDSYMCAGGIPIANKTHPIDSVLAALEIQAIMNQVKTLKEGLGHPYWELRLGIHTGPLVAGVIGEKKFAYDVWGDTVNTASRMESSGTPGMVNISSDTYELVKDFFNCVYRGKIQAKHKGEVDMYYVTGIKEELSVDNDCKTPSYKFWMLHERVKNGEKINLDDLKDRTVAEIEIQEGRKETRKKSKSKKPKQENVEINR